MNSLGKQTFTTLEALKYQNDALKANIEKSKVGTHKAVTKARIRGEHIEYIRNEDIINHVRKQYWEEVATGSTYLAWAVVATTFLVGVIVGEIAINI